MDQSSTDLLKRREELILTSEKSWRLMFLGLMLILIGGFITIDPNSSLLGMELIIMIVGFLLGLIGYFR